MKRRKIINLFSGKYFEVERFIVQRKSKEEVSPFTCYSSSLHSFLVDICISKMARFLSFGKEKEQNCVKT